MVKVSSAVLTAAVASIGLGEHSSHHQAVVNWELNDIIFHHYSQCPIIHSILEPDHISLLRFMD